MTTSHRSFPRKLSPVFFALLLTAPLAGSSIGLAAAPEAAPPGDWVPVAGEFPPPDSGHYFAGELVMVDGINRRGGLRLDGNGQLDSYHRAAPHLFQLLPYGMVTYHGAPAELADVPLGTHLHGTFYLRPEGDTTIPEPTGSGGKYVPKYPYALRLEDDFSFYQRHGQTWRVTEVVPPVEAFDADGKPGQKVEHGTLKLVSEGRTEGDGLIGPKNFTIDPSTRVWKGRELLTVTALEPGQSVQLNSTWSEWWQFKTFHATDVWIDQEARDAATERQRQLHIRRTQYYWMPAWIDSTETTEDGQGIATLTLFGGMDASLYQNVARGKGSGVRLAVAEDTLRSWWQDHDSKAALVLDITRDASPPPGSSGIQLTVRPEAMLEGFRPGRIVRVKAWNWRSVKLPPEYRMEWESFEPQVLK